MNFLLCVECHFSNHFGISLLWDSHWSCWDFLQNLWVGGCKQSLLQVDLLGQILMPVEGPDEVNHQQDIRLCLHGSAYSKWLEFVNNTNNEEHLAALFCLSVPDDLCLTFAVALLHDFLLCCVFIL